MRKPYWIIVLAAFALMPVVVFLIASSQSSGGRTRETTHITDLVLYGDQYSGKQVTTHGLLVSIIGFPIPGTSNLWTLTDLNGNWILVQDEGEEVDLGIGVENQVLGKGFMSEEVFEKLKEKGLDLQDPAAAMELVLAMSDVLVISASGVFSKNPYPGTLECHSGSIRVVGKLGQLETDERTRLLMY